LTNSKPIFTFRKNASKTITPNIDFEYIVVKSATYKHKTVVL